MNHKRKRPKHQRAGCLLCKPWKDERAGGSSITRYWTRSRPGGDRRRMASAIEQQQDATR
jgi:hypothetical protein